MIEQHLNETETLDSANMVEVLSEDHGSEARPVHSPKINMPKTQKKCNEYHTNKPGLNMMCAKDTFCPRGGLLGGNICFVAQLTSPDFDFQERIAGILCKINRSRYNLDDDNVILFNT